jgi:hypothetical protein
MMTVGYRLSLYTDALEAHLARLRRHRERYIRAWVAATGVHPTEAELVETTEHTATGVQTTIRVRRRVQP